MHTPFYPKCGWNNYMLKDSKLPWERGSKIYLIEKFKILPEKGGCNNCVFCSIWIILTLDLNFKTYKLYKNIIKITP